MRWRQGRRSTNVDDRRGRRTVRRAGGLGGGALILVLVALLFGADPGQILQMMGGGGGGPTYETVDAPVQRSAAENELADFVKVVLGDTEDVWRELFPRINSEPYREPTLVLFTDAVSSACGHASAAMGPFYCSADEKVYIDLGFYDDLRRRHDAPGDFAQAYVIAHEIGHHIQHRLGILDDVHRQRGRLSQAEYNALSVRLELQADFLAGVWAHHAQRARGILEPGDIEEALNAASAIGDDRLQMKARGYVVPESFNHGTSEQRVRWFKRGFETGDLSQGDTFAARDL